MFWGDGTRKQTNSIDDLYSDVTKLHSTEPLHTDLNKWHGKRIFPVDTTKAGDAEEGGDEEEDVELTHADFGEENTEGTSAMEAVNPELEKLALEARNGNLGILRCVVLLLPFPFPGMRLEATFFFFVCC